MIGTPCVPLTGATAAAIGVFAPIYDWYPGWRSWQGCFQSCRLETLGMEPPEVVTDQEVKLDAEGVGTIRIDNSSGCHVSSNKIIVMRYRSKCAMHRRRTITASGSVVAAREPFKIYSWLHRGYYRVGDTIEANFIAQTLNRKPVQGSGKLELLRITYDAQRAPQETTVESWDARTNENGSFTPEDLGQTRWPVSLAIEAERRSWA